MFYRPSPSRFLIGMLIGVAVGGAVGRNSLCIIAPCHRVVGSNGSLTGFGGGIDMKVKLLEHEGVDMSSLYRPTRGTAINPSDWLA